MEPELAWLTFKHTIFSLVDRYILSISINMISRLRGLTQNASRHIETRIEPIKNSKIILGLKEILKILSKVKRILSLRDNCSKIYVIKKER